MYNLKALVSLALAAGTINAVALPQPSGTSPTPKDDCKDVKHYFTFGASFSQTMFNENGTAPSVTNPMGNPEKPLTFTGGPNNYVSFLTQKYNSTPVLSYNFARGGATTSRHVVNTGPESTTFEEQLHQHFLPKYGGSNKTWASDNAYFSFQFGNNDGLLAFTGKGKAPDRFTLILQILSKYFEFVDNLYKVGARRFMVLAIPPQDRTPMVKKMDAAKRQAFKDFIIEYNAQLLNRTQEFAKTHEGAYTAYYDANAFFSKVLDDPKAYGFPDATCIDDKGQKCVWFNDFHPGEKFDDLWSARMKIAMDSLGYNGSTPTSGYYA